MRCGQNRSTWCVGALALSLCLLTFSSGCGKGGKGNVSGEVTVAGKPLPIGTIVFTPSQGPAVAAEIIDGKYSAIGVPTGDVKVSLDLNSLKMLADQVAPKGGAAAVGAAFGKGVPEDTTKKKSMAPTAPPGGVEMPPEAKAQLGRAGAGRGRSQPPIQGRRHPVQVDPGQVHRPERLGVDSEGVVRGQHLRRQSYEVTGRRLPFIVGGAASRWPRPTFSPGDQPTCSYG